MGDDTTNLSADEQLARHITAALIQAQIISEERTNELTDRLSSGRMKAEDWNFYIEMGLSRWKGRHHGIPN